MAAIAPRLVELPLEVSQPKDKVAADQWAILAGMRFAMAFIVLVSHTVIIVGFSNPIYRIINALGSPAAVATFFVISGYSIASSLQRDTSHFHARRFWRIYPSYVAAFVISVLAFVFFGSPLFLPYAVFFSPHARSAMGALLFLGGICMPVMEINVPIWTIGVEVIYYALAPLFQYCRTIYIAGLIAVSSIIYGSRFLPFHDGYYNEQRWGFSAAAWLCFWLLGFELYRSRAKWRWVTLLLPVALLSLNNSHCVLAPFTIAAAMVLLVQAPNIVISSDKLRRGLNYLGDLSYPLYLLHYPVFAWVWELFHTRQIFVHLAAALIVSAVVLAVVDHPLRRAWKKISDLRVIALLVSGVVLLAYVGLVYNTRIQRKKQREFITRWVIQTNSKAWVAAEKNCWIAKYNKTY